MGSGIKTYAVVTGASSGIGREFAGQLALTGRPLIISARRGDRLHELKGEIQSKVPSAEVAVIEADLGMKDGIDELLSGINSVLDNGERSDPYTPARLGVFINCAGFGLCGSFDSSDVERETAMIDVNVTAVHVLTKQVLKIMERQNSGYILNVASSAGLFPAGPFMATYYASKAYVASLTQAIAEELREKGSGVHISCLCPGPVDTEFNDVANVKFALRGMTAKDCAKAALKGLFGGKVVIVPTLRMKAAVFFVRLLPRGLMTRIVAAQQKKKF
ncbi:MAG: SDR family oxidoreductase [Lachnospiraceae bacterium]|jgi:short-subunit dehydrogenase|nr:SDR family oxidoreductase [Lachnospiraceae bacterium]